MKRASETGSVPRQIRKPSTESWVWTSALISLLPMALIALALVWFGDFSLKIRITVTVLTTVCCLWFPLFLHERIVFALRTISNLLSSIREKDYVNRLSEDQMTGALAEVYHEVNALRDTLQRERTGAVEAGALLEKVMANIDVSVFAFDAGQRLRLANDHGCALLGRTRERLTGADAASLGLASCLAGPTPRLITLALSGRPRRYEIRSTTFREGGHPHELLVLTDLTVPLRREELEAWRRLVRVLRHEIRNSLAPIQSFSQSLLWMIQQKPRPNDWEQDFTEGLNVIAERTAALNRMLSTNAGLTGPSAPKMGTVDVPAWIKRVTALETRLVVGVSQGPEITVPGDRDQLDQLLINLLRNAVDASLQTGGRVTAGWAKHEETLHVWIEDEGPGLPQTDHLFVPFFTTKQNGTGIGLVVSRQIAEAHGGSLHLDNKESGHGCRATLELPIS